MNAWFSGGYRQALLKDNNEYYLLAIEPEKNTPIEQSKIKTITRDWEDVYSLEVESVADALLELHRASKCYEAMLLASLAIDENVSYDRREQAIIQAEIIFEEKFTKDYVLNIYCAHPMPESADLITSKEFCIENALSEFNDLIETVDRYKSNIAAARSSWDNIDDNIFGNLTNRLVLQAQVIRAGLFLDMVLRIGNIKRCEKLIDKVAETNLAYIPSFEEIIMQWIHYANIHPINNHSPSLLFSELENPALEGDSVQIFAGVTSSRPAFTYA